MKLHDAVEEAATDFRDWYLDWVNNFLTVKGYASWHDISEAEAEKRLRIGRKIHEQRLKNQGE